MMTSREFWQMLEDDTSTSDGLVALVTTITGERFSGVVENGEGVITLSPGTGCEVYVMKAHIVYVTVHVLD